MIETNARRVLIVAFALSSLLASCSGDHAIKDPPDEQEREFGEEDKMAARALSISQGRSVIDADSPYARALLCKNGMEVLAQRLQNAAVLNEQQRHAVQWAREHFDRQLQAMGEGEGKTADEIRGDLEQTARNHFDTTENAQVAITCLQGLQETG